MKNPDRHPQRTDVPRCDRRQVLRALGLCGAGPLLAWPAGAEPATTDTRPPAGRSGEVEQGRPGTPGIYQRLPGVRPLINAAGPVTALGGTVLTQEVTAAMAEAALSYVDLDELYTAAGARLAEITKAEAAMVTSGAFAAMTLGAAACLAGEDEEKMAALPHPTWPRRETVIQRAHSTPYDRAYRNAGMSIVYVDTEDEMLAAIMAVRSPIAGLTNVEQLDRPGIVSPERLVSIGRRTGVPVYLDASFCLNRIPNVPGLWRYTDMGADLVGISGGKGLHGPQSTGILAGRADLVAAARKQASPNPAGLGRGMKVDKEEVIGLLVALEQFLARDHEALYRRDRERVETMRKRRLDVPGLELRYEEAFFGPGLVLMWDGAEIPLTHDEFVQRMRAGERPIAVIVADGPGPYFVADVKGPALFANALNDGEEVVVAERARDVLLSALRAGAGRRRAG